MKFTIVFLLLCLPFCFNAQVLGWEWAKSFGGANSDKGKSISNDSLGNIYMTGTIRGNASFNNIDIQAIDENNNFIAKFSQLGEPIWVKTIGFSSSLNQQSIEVGKERIFVSGYLDDTTVVDGFTLGVPGQSTSFVISLDFEGNFIWGKTIKRITTIALAVSDLDEVIFNCIYTDSIVVDNQVYFGNSIYNGIIFLFDSQGNNLWYKSCGTNIFFSINAIDIRSNKIAITGQFRDSINFEGNTYQCTYTKGMFTSLYSKQGDFLWAKIVNSPTNCASADVDLDQNLNVYVCGSHHQSSEFDGQILLSSSNGTGYFVKYDSLGTLVWVKSFDPGTNGCSRIKVAQNNNIFIAGSFFANISIEGQSVNDNPNATADMFLLKIDEYGNPIWLMNCTSTTSGWNFLMDMIVVGNSIYLTGYISGQNIFFGSHEIGSIGGDDVFLSRLNNVLGIESLKELSEGNFYPNPVKSESWLYSNMDLEQKPILIFNLNGELISTAFIENSKFLIPKLHAGIYFLKYRGKNNEIYNSKLIIE